MNKNYGNVLTYHVAFPEIEATKKPTDEEIWNNDMSFYL